MIEHTPAEFFDVMLEQEINQLLQNRERHPNGIPEEVLPTNVGSRFAPYTSERNNPLRQYWHSTYADLPDLVARLDREYANSIPEDQGIDFKSQLSFEQRVNSIISDYLGLIFDGQAIAIAKKLISTDTIDNLHVQQEKFLARPDLLQPRGTEFNQTLEFPMTINEHPGACAMVSDAAYQYKMSWYFESGGQRLDSQVIAMRPNIPKTRYSSFSGTQVQAENTDPIDNIRLQLWDRVEQEIDNFSPWVKKQKK